MMLGLVGLGQQIVGTNLVIGTGHPGTLVTNAADPYADDPMLTLGPSIYDVSTPGNPVDSSNLQLTSILGCPANSVVFGSTCWSITDLAFGGLAVVLVLMMGKRR